jgi:hypothetical protein
MPNTNVESPEPKAISRNEYKWAITCRGTTEQGEEALYWFIEGMKEPVEAEIHQVSPLGFVKY